MLIQGSSAHRPIQRPANHIPKPETEVACPTPVGDRLDFECGNNSPLGEGNFSAAGVTGKMMQWTARELPSNQKPMSEEEKQKILESLEPGDVILTYASHRPNLGHLEYWTTGADYTHCALYEGYGRIIETLGSEVMRSPLIDRLHGTIKVAVVRPPYKNFRDRGLVIREAKKLVGTPYDYKFDNKDASELYCSEFIEVAMKRVDPDLDVPDASFLGREITAPDAFLDMKGAKLIHDGRSDYWKNQLHQWPLWVGSAVGAGLGTALGVSFGGGAVGALGGVIGAVAGFEGTLAASRFLK